jgi:hypothetical protein
MVLIHTDALMLLQESMAKLSQLLLHTKQEFPRLSAGKVVVAPSEVLGLETVEVVAFYDSLLS